MSAFFSTPDRLIRSALLDAGKIALGDTPNSDRYADSMDRLNDIMNFEQTQGTKLCLLTNTPVTLVANKAVYLFGPSGDVLMQKPLAILQANYIDINGIRRPLDPPMSWQEYTSLANPTQAGAVSQYFVDKQASVVRMTLYLVPDTQAATGSVECIVRNQIQNVAQLNDTMAFAPEWFIFLRWALAEELATGQPDAVIQRCTANAERYRTALRDWDVEDASTSMAPDFRTGQSIGAFRL